MMPGSAVEAGITVINEVGLDPGIDHLLAMECFDEVQLGCGRVDSFVSYCGGLPAPECSDNALRSQFSWSPRGALLNTMSGARYLKDGKVGVFSLDSLLATSLNTDPSSKTGPVLYFHPSTSL